MDDGRPTRGLLRWTGFHGGPRGRPRRRTRRGWLALETRSRVALVTASRLRACSFVFQDLVEFRAEPAAEHLHACVVGVDTVRRPSVEASPGPGPAGQTPTFPQVRRRRSSRRPAGGAPSCPALEGPFPARGRPCTGQHPDKHREQHEPEHSSVRRVHSHRRPAAIMSGPSRPGMAEPHRSHAQRLRPLGSFRVPGRARYLEARSA